MAKTPKDRDQPAEAHPPLSAPERIAVTNMCRHRPILFHFAGGSARLGPLETLELDHDTLASPELAFLVASGEVQVSTVVPPAAGPAVDRRKPAPDSGTEG
jgi:hypothetical protein